MQSFGGGRHDVRRRSSAEAVGAAVVTDYNGRGAISEDYPLFLSRAGA